MQNRLLLHGANPSTWVDPQQIVYIGAQGSYCRVVLEDRQSLRASKNLLYVSDKPPAYCNSLIRVHKSRIVNLPLAEPLEMIEQTICSASKVKQHLYTEQSSATEKPEWNLPA